MRKKVMSIAIFCLISLSNSAHADNAAPTVPTEVGTTTMPPGNYLVIDQSTGNKYSLEVTSKGTMIFGPAAATSTTTTSTTPAATPAAANAAANATAPKAASGVKGIAEKQVEKYIQNKGMSEIQNFIK